MEWPDAQAREAWLDTWTCDIRVGKGTEQQLTTAILDPTLFPNVRVQVVGLLVSTIPSDNGGYAVGSGSIAGTGVSMYVTTNSVWQTLDFVDQNGRWIT